MAPHERAGLPALEKLCHACGDRPSVAAACCRCRRARPTDETFAIHGQATFIDQYHPAFRSLYRGADSLDPGSRGDETVNITAYAGARPWDGGEAWADLEMDQGFGLSNTLGVAAFTNGEGSKVGKAVPYLRLHRLFFRQTFDLGGEQRSGGGRGQPAGRQPHAMTIWS